jgi:hypothetical protein
MEAALAVHVRITAQDIKAEPESRTNADLITSQQPATVDTR